MNIDNSAALRTESIGKLLFRFSVPAIVGMLVNALYNIVDGIFVGRYVGSLGLAGVSVSYPIMIVVLAFIMLIGFGATSLISIRLGEGRTDEAEQILGNATTLLFIVPVILFVLVQLFLNDILMMFGASEAVLPFARTYMSVVSFGFLFQSIGFGMNNFIRSEGNPKMAMFTMLIGAVLNTILDAIFIIGLDMGIKGGALATVLAQLISSIWVLRYFFSGKSLLKIRRENLKLKIDTVRYIVVLGFAQFSVQIANSIVAVVANKTLLAYGGDLAISAYRIINNTAMIFLMPTFGINQGAQPIIGYNFGAKQYERVRKTLFLAIGAATGVALIGFVITQFFPEQIVMLFTKDDKQLIELTSKGMRIFLVALPIIGFQIVSSNFFQAIGKPKRSILLGLSRQVIILIPATLILPTFFELKGVWIAAPVSDFLSVVLTTYFLVKSVKALNRGIAGQGNLDNIQNEL